MGITSKELQDLLHDNPDIALVDDGAALRYTYHVTPVAAQLAMPTEHDEQVALFEWAAANEVRHPELMLLHSTPMGGHRHPAVGAMLQKEGAKRGFPDISMNVARGRWHSFHLELKRADRSTRPTSEQLLWIERLREYGNFACVAYGCAEAINIIMSYLAQEG